MFASAVVFDCCLQVLKNHTKVRIIYHLAIYHWSFFTFRCSLFTFFTYFATLILQMCAKIFGQSIDLHYLCKRIIK